MHLNDFLFIIYREKTNTLFLTIHFLKTFIFVIELHLSPKIGGNLRNCKDDFKLRQ